MPNATRFHFLRILLKFGLPLGILALGVFASQRLIDTAPKVSLKVQEKPKTAVEVVQIAPRDYRVSLSTQGIITPHTQTTLSAEVSGRITQISPKFKAGGFFDQDEIILQIDPKDYEQALLIARGEQTQAQISLQDEKVKREQARRDYGKLGFKGKPSALTLREPQIKTAKARLNISLAKISQAKTRLQRTTITAPYAGRILNAESNIGQFVSLGTKLGTLYATDFVELRVPINDKQAAFLDFPETFQGESKRTELINADIKVTQGEQVWHWPGTLVRTEGTIDTQSRQQFVVIQIEAPYARHSDQRPPLKVGQFVRAELEGKLLESVFVIPRKYFYDGNELQIVDDNNLLERRKMPVLWRDEENIIIASGLRANENIIRTPLSFASAGMEVVIKEAKAE